MGDMTTTTTDPHAARERDLATLGDALRAADAVRAAARDALDHAVHQARQERVSYSRIARAIGWDDANVIRRYKAWLRRQGLDDGAR